MWTEEDKEIAELAAHALEKLQGKKSPDVLRELENIRGQVVNKRNDEHERAEAWLSICRLAERLEKVSDDPSIPGLWHRAIQATNAWHGSMN